MPFQYYYQLVQNQLRTKPLVENKPPVEQSSAPQKEATPTISESEQLNQWFADRYNDELSRSPITLTMLGCRDLNDQIDDFSETAEQELLQWRENTVNDLQANFDYKALSDDEKVPRGILWHISTKKPRQ